MNWAEKASAVVWAWVGSVMLSDWKRIKLKKMSSLPLFFWHVTKGSVLVIAIGTNGRVGDEVDGRDGRDIHARIDNLQTCLEKVVWVLFFGETSVSALPAAEHCQCRWRFWPNQTVGARGHFRSPARRLQQTVHRNRLLKQQGQSPTCEIQ